MTTHDGLLFFIEAMSGGQEVKDVSMLTNGNALVTMVDDIKGKSAKLSCHLVWFEI